MPTAPRRCREGIHDGITRTADVHQPPPHPPMPASRQYRGFYIDSNLSTHPPAAPPRHTAHVGKLCCGRSKRQLIIGAGCAKAAHRSSRHGIHLGTAPRGASSVGSSGGGHSIHDLRVGRRGVSPTGMRGRDSAAQKNAKDQPHIKLYRQRGSAELCEGACNQPRASTGTPNSVPNVLTLVQNALKFENASLPGRAFHLPYLLRWDANRLDEEHEGLLDGLGELHDAGDEGLALLIAVLQGHTKDGTPQLGDGILEAAWRWRRVAWSGGSVARDKANVDGEGECLEREGWRVDPRGGGKVRHSGAHFGNSFGARSRVERDFGSSGRNCHPPRD